MKSFFLYLNTILYVKLIKMSLPKVMVPYSLRHFYTFSVIS